MSIFTKIAIREISVASKHIYFLLSHKSKGKQTRNKVLIKTNFDFFKLKIISEKILSLGGKTGINKELSKVYKIYEIFELV